MPDPQTTATMPERKGPYEVVSKTMLPSHPPPPPLSPPIHREPKSIMLAQEWVVSAIQQGKFSAYYYVEVAESNQVDKPIQYQGKFYRDVKHTLPQLVLLQQTWAHKKWHVELTDF